MPDDTEPVAPQKRRFSVSKVLDGFLDSPISGIAPWILLAVVGSPGRYEGAIAIAFGFSIFVMWAGWRRGDRLHSLTLFGVVFFGLLLAVRMLIGTGVEDWLSTWTGEMSNIALTVFAVTTLIVRRPFTLSYAKDMTPEEYWDTPVFRRTNYVISAVWAAAFAFCAVFGFIGITLLHDSDNFWTGWILQLGATFFAVAFTDVYPDYVGAKADREAGESTEPAPSLLPVVDWIPTYVLIVGIIGWVIDAIPDWLAVTMIAVGAIGSAVVRRFAPKTD
ncbi:hypothetical protein [Mycolicibacterium moriokaense]|jgi:hypothetical protein|uniref:Uncharacterized protein n=1 Tax=Mycolicibacterium moriokaense TaxID=39691 RepID=A0AAD1HDD8_9MYCO|nr:hypothetical protein [Mycolicibacterium moriokaense]BBX01958.1 hypothetical protein MMOR_28940 [Mycolicibacterium moriokaense]